MQTNRIFSCLILGSFLTQDCLNESNKVEEPRIKWQKAMAQNMIENRMLRNQIKLHAEEKRFPSCQCKNYSIISVFIVFSCEHSNHANQRILIASLDLSPRSHSCKSAPKFIYIHTLLVSHFHPIFFLFLFTFVIISLIYFSLFSLYSSTPNVLQKQSRLL